jgi:hypothetical protein
MVLCRCSLKEIRLAMRDVRLVEFHKDSWVDYTSKPCVLCAHLKVPSFVSLSRSLASEVPNWPPSIEKCQSTTKGCGKTHACNIFSFNLGTKQTKPQIIQNVSECHFNGPYFWPTDFPYMIHWKHILSMWTIRFPMKKWPVFWWFGGHFRKLLKYPHTSNPHLAPCLMDNSPYSSAENPWFNGGFLSHGC